MEKNIGLIGFGDWGKKLAHQLEIQGSLCAILKSSKENLESILNNSSVKGVIIATPIRTHYEIAKSALEAAKHVFLEKPATDNLIHLNELIQLAEERNLIFQIGYEFVFSEKLQEIKQQIEGKPIKSIRFKWIKWGSFKAHPVINLLVHELSMLKFLGINSLEHIEYHEEKVKEITESTIPEIVEIKSKSGEIEITFEINISSKDTKEHSVTIITDSETHVWKDGGENLVEKELNAFTHSIQTGEKPKVDGKFAKDILEIINNIPWKRL